MLPSSLFPTDVQKPRLPQQEPKREWQLPVGKVTPFLGYLFSRVLTALVTFLIVTSAVYGISVLTPVDERARLYLPERQRYLAANNIRAYLDIAIENHGLDDPFPIQYGRWLGNLAQGNWGYSAVLGTDVLSALSARSPATLELTLFSILIYVPLGLLAGGYLAWKQGSWFERILRGFSYVATAIPPFILGFMLIAVVYVQLGFLDISRISSAESALLRSDTFSTFTGLITVDGLLNLRLDIAYQAVRHLILPVATLVTFYVATLILVTRASAIEEMQKEYVQVAKGMGLKDRRILFTYALRNAMLPGLNHSAITAAQLVTGVFVVEAIFNWHGVSDILVDSMGSGIPDVDLALGFCVYTIVVVLCIVFLLDLVQGFVDPRVRMGLE